MYGHFKNGNTYKVNVGRSSIECVCGSPDSLPGERTVWRMLDSRRNDCWANEHLGDSCLKRMATLYINLKGGSYIFAKSE